MNVCSLKYGDEEFEQEPIEDFEAYQDRQNRSKHIKMKWLRNSAERLAEKKGFKSSKYNKEWLPSSLAVSSRDVKLAVLQNRYLSAKDIESKLAASILVQDEIEYRLSVDLLFDELVKYVVGYSNELVDGELVDALKFGHSRPSDYLCLKSVYSEYERKCEKFSDYSLQYVSVLVNLCEIYNDANIIHDALQTVCQ